MWKPSICDTLASEYVNTEREKQGSQSEKTEVSQLTYMLELSQQLLTRKRNLKTLFGYSDSAGLVYKEVCSISFPKPYTESDTTNKNIAIRELLKQIMPSMTI